MKTRSFADLIVGVLAYVSLSGLAAAVTDRSAASRTADRRWSLPGKRRMRVAEDGCRHCKGSGKCDACLPAPCRICRGSGLQPHDHALSSRLDAIWDGVR